MAKKCGKVDNAEGSGQDRRDEGDAMLRHSRRKNPAYARSYDEDARDLTIIFDDPQLGADMLMWHSGMGDVVYRVGSLIHAEQEVPVGLVEGARDTLDHLRNKGQFSTEDEDLLDDIISNLNHALQQAGIEDEDEDEDDGHSKVPP